MVRIGDTIRMLPKLMTWTEIAVISVLYSVAFAVVAYLTPAKSLRICGAVAGGAVFGAVAMFGIVQAEAHGLWHVTFASAQIELLVWVGLAISCAPAYLITWRVARRFDGRGLVICAASSALIGPPRDYWIAAKFPDWMRFAPGAAPILADAFIYALLVIVGME
jgi:hypothetical protein